ncbi:unnamed protein product [Withania somnifera]
MVVPKIFFSVISHSHHGEGAVNLVLAYNGQYPQFVWKVLRVQKVPRNGSKCENGHPGLTEMECLIWKEFEELVSAPTREIAECYFVHVLAIGFKEFDNNVLCQRPSCRVDAAKVLMCTLKKDFCMSVEIKPKCGFLPLSEFIAPENTIKRSVSRFKMHQTLKFHQRKISEISAYDPLDLFSGSRDRVQKAIKGLFRTPLNNFQIFLNSSLILGGLGGNAEATSCEVGETFENALKCVIQAVDGQLTKCFLDLISETIFSSGLLNKLLEAQKLDNLDIGGAIHAYYNVISQPCMVCKKRSAEDQLSKRYDSLHSSSKDESLKIVRNFLIAATAKDPSVMISFRPREDGSVESPYSMVSLKSTNQSFHYKAYFIDLDLKPLERMEYYYNLTLGTVFSFYTRYQSQPTSEEALTSASDPFCLFFL